MNTIAQAGSTTHHLNVTVGEDKFYYTANPDQNPQIPGRLPNIANQSGSSSRFKTQFGNEYVGLMSKKNKGATAAERGSTDVNVQSSLALGGPAFNIKEARA